MDLLTILPSILVIFKIGEEDKLWFNLAREKIGLKRMIVLYCSYKINIKGTGRELLKD
jgi:hypothetical protein